MLRFSPNPNLAHLIHWCEWEDDAFQRAREQDKPVALFVGAFWCGYCQRMDQEAFSDRENMALLNAYFVPLRIENARRPDIDARYNLNGWPTLAFFAPNGRLLAAANYLAADDFKECLLNLYLEYQRHKDELRAIDHAGGDVAIGENKNALPDRLSLDQIASAVLARADRVYGGYGNGQKFIHAEANEFLLSRYEAINDRGCLDHVRLTLDRMRASPIYDEKDGGYFRTTTGADWVQPHREKLLAEQAGLLGNCLHLFRITQLRQYARMAEEIIGYLDRKLFDPSRPAFFGCEDFLRHPTADQTTAGEFFSVIDQCIYTDANAQAIVGYLEAASMLGRPELKRRATDILEFLWVHCHNEHQGMFHYLDEGAKLPGLLIDQARMGIALLRGFHATENPIYLNRAKELAAMIRSRLRNPAGGYFDRSKSELGFLGAQLSLIDQNGVAASFFLMLADAAKEPGYREAARWALSGIGVDLASYGIHASQFGQSLGEWLYAKI